MTNLAEDPTASATTNAEGGGGGGALRCPPPAVVLVEPQLGENIGAAARAMANFGLADLRLVAPRDGWPSEKARAAASRADHVVDGARVFATTAEAVADLRFVYATTARTRGLPKVVVGPREAAATLRARAAAGQGTGILFGRERWGLMNEEIALADEIVTFPVEPAFASLNIAQAVLLMSYEWMASGLEAGALPTRGAVPAFDATPAPKAQLVGLMEHLEQALDEAAYFRSEDKRPAMVANLRAILQRAGFTEPEVKVLRGVVAALERRHEKRRRASGNE
ncbi:RNA methyltransferase [Faunimonas sp. B44]|uniref:RNA methyltransferase n=1 Tax=Faunimonas sp. B44 TaxID=3461493 RepID=UPI004044CF74